MRAICSGSGPAPSALGAGLELGEVGADGVAAAGRSTSVVASSAPAGVATRTVSATAP